MALGEAVGLQFVEINAACHRFPVRVVAVPDRYLRSNRLGTVDQHGNHLPEQIMDRKKHLGAAGEVAFDRGRRIERVGVVLVQVIAGREITFATMVIGRSTQNRNLQGIAPVGGIVEKIFGADSDLVGLLSGPDMRELMDGVWGPRACSQGCIAIPPVPLVEDALIGVRVGGGNAEDVG